ncbi:MAG: hypothetical protein NC548_57365 [Lachnospiraceae bacterium]|nr:hypothetical protein [Lachnospiraceae bacterium]
MRKEKTAMKYAWKDGVVYRGKADAQEVAEEIEKCEDRTPTNIVSMAKDGKFIYAQLV